MLQFRLVEDGGQGGNGDRPGTEEARRPAGAIDDRRGDAARGPSSVEDDRQVDAATELGEDLAGEDRGRLAGPVGGRDGQRAAIAAASARGVVGGQTQPDGQGATRELDG